MAYDLIALLTDKATVTLEQFGRQLGQKFSSDPNAEVLLKDEKTLVLRWKDWAFRIAYEADPHVLEESREIAERHRTTLIDESVIAACRRRLMVTADEDPFMEHFNDYLLLEEVLMAFPGVILFDPQEKAFVEKGQVELSQIRSSAQR